jgi:hypothetical protein
VKKPNSPKYRNLYVPADRDTIWYARLVGGRPHRANTQRSPETLEGWKEAALWRDEYEEAKGIGRARSRPMPTFAELAARYGESSKFDRMAFLAVLIGGLLMAIPVRSGPLAAWIQALAMAIIGVVVVYMALRKQQEDRDARAAERAAARGGEATEPEVNEEG